jgi:hypothetical protein
MSEERDPRDAPDWPQQVEARCRNLPRDICYLCRDATARQGLGSYCACPIVAHEQCVADSYIAIAEKKPKCGRCYTPIEIEWSFRDADRPCPHRSYELFMRQWWAGHTWKAQLAYHIGPESAEAVYWLIGIGMGLFVCLFMSGCTSFADTIGQTPSVFLFVAMISLGWINTAYNFGGRYWLLWIAMYLVSCYGLPACDETWREKNETMLWIFLRFTNFAWSIETILHVLVALSAPLEMIGKVQLYQPPITCPGCNGADLVPGTAPIAS